jgi:protein-L-isoaspartate(D-aspartate) O-methyltransferase
MRSGALDQCRGVASFDAGMRHRAQTPRDLAEAVRAEGIRDPRVLAALREVPRAGFVPPDLASRAYADEPLPIPRDQVTTQPSLVARMVEALGLSGSETVLEVGTGYGFQTALLARLSRFVWSVERWHDIAEAARLNLAREGVHNVSITVGDGTEGLPRHSPFDAVIVSAAFTQVPPPLARQVAPGGHLVQPIGPGGAEEVVLFVKGEDGLERRSIVTGARFVPLCGRHGFR